MAGVLLGLWSGAVWWGAGRSSREHAVRAAMAIGLAVSMAMQVMLLWLDGQLTLQTGLPLHLCGLFGVLSIPMLLWRAPQPLYELSAFLAGPAAAVTLLFPAVIESSRPMLMRLAFLQLHVLVALTPVMLWRAGKPLPTDPRRALVLASGYLLAVAALNRALHTNYLFLSAAPAGTPLQWLYARGGGYYVCALSMLCMTLFRLLADAYRRAAISGNR